jgi:hypothetical protein
MGNVRGKKKTKILCCEVLGVKFFLGGDALATLEVVPFLYHMGKPIPPTNIGVSCSFLLLFFFSFQFDFLSLSFVGFLPSVKWWKFLMWLCPWDLFPKRWRVG